MFAEGARPAETREDILLERTLLYHAFAFRYGWTIEETDAQPRWFKRRAPVIWEIINDLQGE